MELLVWIVTGFSAGWLTGYALKGRGYGMLGNLLIGLGGGVVGGWIFRTIGVAETGDGAMHVLVSLVGAVSLVTLVRVLDGAARKTKVLPRASTSLAGDLEMQMRRLGRLERKVISQYLRKKPVATDPNSEFDARTTFGQRIADRVAAFGGSWTFIALFLSIMAIWMIVNLRAARPFDQYPFILLNLVLSCLAALQAPVIMMSQNRQAAKDRLDAQHDYQVNLKAEMEILSLHTKLDEVRERDWIQLMELQQQQIRVLARLERFLNRNDPEMDDDGSGEPQCEI